MTEDVTPGNGQSNKVRYCFDQNVASVTQQSAGFALQGYDSRRADFADDGFTPSNTGGDVVIDVNNNSCVIVGFPDEIDVRQFTVGEVDPDEVRKVPTDQAASGNVLDSAPLTGGFPRAGLGGEGRTDGPDLISTAKLESNNQIDYVFDKALVPGNDTTDPDGGGPLTQACNPAKFIFYTADGSIGPKPALSCDVVNNVVRATFNPAANLPGDSPAATIQRRRGSSSAAQGCLTCRRSMVSRSRCRIHSRWRTRLGIPTRRPTVRRWTTRRM